MIHLAAKRRLVEALAERERPFVLRRTCTRYGCEVTRDDPWEPPPYDEAREEVTLGAYRLDVATLLKGDVALGLEVFFQHRVGRAKAAGLIVPWLEICAETTAQDPYLLCPVVDSSLGELDEVHLRSRLGATQADLHEVLRNWLINGVELDDHLGRPIVSSHLVNQLFDAQVEAGSFFEPWWCEACESAWERHIAAQARRELLEAEAQEERARLGEELRRAHAQAFAEQLAEQRAVFGPELVRPFGAHHLAYYKDKAPVLRMAVRYLERKLPRYRTSLPAWHDQTLIARRCWSCREPILCAVVHSWVGDAKGLYPMVEYFKPDPNRRGSFVSRCLHCGKRQRNRDAQEGKHVPLGVWQILDWIEAFTPS